MKALYAEKNATFLSFCPLEYSSCLVTGEIFFALLGYVQLFSSIFFYLKCMFFGCAEGGSLCGNSGCALVNALSGGMHFCSVQWALFSLLFCSGRPAAASARATHCKLYLLNRHRQRPLRHQHCLLRRSHRVCPLALGWTSFKKGFGFTVCLILGVSQV